VAVAPYLVFFLAALAFGYAAQGRWKWIPLIFPVVLFLIAVFQEGASGATVVRLIVALVVAALGVLLGILVERRAGESSTARYA
jgi:4-amino-4-deoxy-L-arabinose transferase-like glycosyltransferase